MTARGADIAVIGAGIVGLAAADALVRQGARVLVVEAERAIAQHQTGHNSGVIHAGLYYRPGSEKARLCRSGRALLLEFCEQYGVPVDVCGKLVVATRKDELPRLDELERRGRANGLQGLERLDRKQIREREPNAAGIDGLLVPETSIVDFRVVAEALAARCREQGAEIRTDAKLTRVVAGRGTGSGSATDRVTGPATATDTAHPPTPTGVTLRTTAGPFHARFLLNCAGLEADRVARLCGVDPGVTLVPFRGEYHRLLPPRRDLVRHILYPVPDPALPFLGVHFTRTMTGEIEIGPNAVLAGSRTGYARGDIKLRDLADMLSSEGFRKLARARWRTGAAEWMRSRSTRVAVRAMRRLVPKLCRRDIERAGSGVRAQAVSADGQLVDDFVLVEGPGSLHVVNAPSPAATAALGIGAELAERCLAARS